jgi:2'-5' RNA ligase
MRRSAVVLPVTLPAGLERIRRIRVAEARRGVPAHVTLLFPFVDADRIDDRVTSRLRDRLAAVAPFEYALEATGRWPDAVYAAPVPAEPFATLAAVLRDDWPEYPLYGGDFAFEAHVTIAESPSDDVARAIESAAASELPAPARADEVVLIVDADTGWRVAARFALGGR